MQSVFLEDEDRRRYFADEAIERALQAVHGCCLPAAHRSSHLNKTPQSVWTSQPAAELVNVLEYPGDALTSEAEALVLAHIKWLQAVSAKLEEA